MDNPVLVNTTRGGRVESRHRGAVAVCDPRGRVVYSQGDIESLVFPRSAIKALQAIPLVESGAAAHFCLSKPELALACSSHNSEPGHTTAVSSWLERLGLGCDDLECGAHAPLHQATADAMIRDGVTPGREHNNCSGKHAGMLTLSRHLGAEPGGYITREHVAQQAWFDAVGEMSDQDMRALPWSYDGCGIPVIAMPLRSVATAFARFAQPDDLDNSRADAIETLSDAIAEHPFMVAGSGRLCTELMEITGRRVLVKTGAEAVYTASISERGLGIALKIDDGRSEAAEVAILAALRAIGALRGESRAQLRWRGRRGLGDANHDHYSPSRRRDSVSRACGSQVDC